MRLLKTIGSVDFTGQERAALNKLTMPLRRLVRTCSGDWEWARRALAAAGGDVIRARVMVERRRAAKGR